MKNIQLIIAIGICISSSYNFATSDNNQGNADHTEKVAAIAPSTTNFMPETNKQSDEAIMVALLYKYVLCMQTEATNQPTEQCSKIIKICNKSFNNELLAKMVSNSIKR